MFNNCPFPSCVIAQKTGVKSALINLSIELFFAKLSIFQPNKYKFKKSCPLSVKGAPVVDYKNIRLLKKYMSENGKILPSRITNVSQKKQRELSLSIKRARNLALI